MAHIVVITHEYDEFWQRRRFWQPRICYYLIGEVMAAMARRGHSWQVVAGPRFVPGDLAVLHIDATVVEADYLALAPRYPAAVNFAVADISKRLVSGALLERQSSWTGQVIVKTDKNFFGRPEAAHNERASRAGRPLPYPGLTSPPLEYTVLPSIADLQERVWDDPALVVERFIPEPDERGYALRSWVFCGPAERCSRHVAAEPMVKAPRSISRTAVEVPAELRLERKRLGFDYGKFDFAVHEGVPVLLDANRTPGRPPVPGKVARLRAQLLADGLEAMLRQGA